MRRDRQAAKKRSRRIQLLIITLQKKTSLNYLIPLVTKESGAS
jgi:hypothetical protein